MKAALFKVSVSLLCIHLGKKPKRDKLIPSSPFIKVLILSMRRSLDLMASSPTKWPTS
jgi:hypothetical protein